VNSLSWDHPISTLSRDEIWSISQIVICSKAVYGSTVRTAHPTFHAWFSSFWVLNPIGARNAGTRKEGVRKEFLKAFVDTFFVPHKEMNTELHVFEFRP